MGGVRLSFGTAYRAKKTDKPVEFIRPPWAREIDSLIGYGRRIHQKHLEHGGWWMEHEGTVNDLWDAERARDELIKVTFSYWDYVKNKSDRWEFADNKSAPTDVVRYYELVEIPFMNAKRETRRLEGDYILTQHDVMSGRMFPDRIAYAGWPLDVHHPEGIYSGEEGSFEFDIVVPVNSIPFRCVYSKNIDNLLFAGRCGSFTHLALGSVRVQSTLATIGQAAGTAAAMCIEKGIDPRDIYQDHMTELQQTLLKYDQSIPGIKNEDAMDLARGATITASSNLSGEDLNPEDHVLKRSVSVKAHDHSALIPLEELEELSTIRLYFKSTNRQMTMVDVRVEGVKKMGKRGQKLNLGQYRLQIAPYAQRWMILPLPDTIPGDIDFLRIEVPVSEGVSWPSVRWTAQPANPVFKTVEYKPGNISNGWTRLAENKASLWSSDPSEPLPQWIELDLGEPKELNTVHLTFDTDLSTVRPDTSHHQVCVKSYKLSAFANNRWITLAEIGDNIQRHRIHKFNKVITDRLRLTIKATHGAPSARVFEMRAYNEQ
jgi:hypothetical protein